MKNLFRSTASAGQTHVNGFTLIELMIVLAIVAILATIAYPSYQQQILKGHRADAKSAVLEVAAREEKYFATHNKYSNIAGELNYTSIPFDVISSGQKVYSLGVTINTTGAPAYTITATPSGSQAVDVCYAYVINNFGVQSNMTAGGIINNTAGCW